MNYKYLHSANIWYGVIRLLKFMQKEKIPEDLYIGKRHYKIITLSSADSLRSSADIDSARMLNHSISYPIKRWRTDINGCTNLRELKAMQSQLNNLVERTKVRSVQTQYRNLLLQVTKKIGCTVNREREARPQDEVNV